MNGLTVEMIYRRGRYLRGGDHIPSQLEYDATLRWNTNPEPDIAGYRILVRKTSSPQWERSIDVGNRTTYTVKGISKDNYLLGVQAYDRTRNESLVAFPRPGR